MTEVTITGVRSMPEDDGSHIVEFANGSVAVIPADQISAVVQRLQWGLAQRVFAQSQQFEHPTDSTLALGEFHLMDVRVATRDRSTSLACNLGEYGWVSLLSEDEILRQMKDRIDEVLMQRSASQRPN